MLYRRIQISPDLAIAPPTDGTLREVVQLEVGWSTLVPLDRQEAEELRDALMEALE